jgi:membrane protease YdiL (CAAX protease family)
MEEAKLDRKGIFCFLSITFVVTYIIEGVLILTGFRVAHLPAMYGQFTVVAVMWVPALATVLTIRFITDEGFAIANLHFGSWKPYVTAGLLVPSCFVTIYAVTWLMGLGQPDWKLDRFLATVGAGAGTGPASTPSPFFVLPVLYLVALVISPLVNGVFGFGEELGWRGYLLPKLMV